MSVNHFTPLNNKKKGVSNKKIALSQLKIILTSGLRIDLSFTWLFRSEI